jgi:hypothetical protein
MTVSVIDPKFEIEVLAAAASDAGFRGQAKRVLTDHNFTDPKHAWVWKVVDSLPPTDSLTPAILKARAKKDFREEDDEIEHLMVAAKILRHKPVAPVTSMKEVVDFARYGRMSAGIEKSIKLLDKGDIDAAQDALYESSRYRGPADYRGGDWYERFKSRMEERLYHKEHPEMVVRIPTGWETLDKHFRGGVNPGSLNLVVGNTSKGKSATICHLAVWSALNGYNTAIIGAEMTDDEYNIRIDARITGYTIDQLENYDLTDEDLEIIQNKMDRLGKLRRKLKVFSAPIRGLTFEMIEQVLDDCAADGETVQCLLLDSLDHAKSSRKYNDFRIEQAGIYWDGKSLAVERNIALWSSTHAAKEAVDKIATSENLAESYDKARIADRIFTLNQTKMEAKHDRLTGYVAKNRGGKAKGFVKLQANFSKMEIVETTEELPEDEEEEEDDD